MKHFKLAILATAAILALAACKNEIDLDTRYITKQLALNGYINADSTDNTLSVSWTSPRVPILVADAKMQITVNGQLRQTIQGTTDPQKRYHISGKFNPGDRVRIDVTTADGEKHIYVEETIPQPIQRIDSLRAEYLPRVSYINNNNQEASSPMFKVSIHFPDNQTVDFYRLIIDAFRTKRTFNDPNPLLSVVEHSKPQRCTYIATADPVVMEGKVITKGSNDAMETINGGSIANRYGVFNDLGIGGRNCSINVYVSPDYLVPPFSFDNDSLSADLRVSICSFNEPAYYYLRAMNLRESDYYEENNELSGPVKMPSNVNGGTGIVGFYTSRSMPLKVFGNDRYPGLFN